MPSQEHFLKHLLLLKSIILLKSIGPYSEHRYEHYINEKNTKLVDHLNETALITDYQSLNEEIQQEDCTLNFCFWLETSFQAGF